MKATKEVKHFVDLYGNTDYIEWISLIYDDKTLHIYN